MFILVFSKLGSWKLKNWVPFISLEVTKLNEAVNANRLVPRVCLWLSRSVKCFPSWQMLWSRKGSGKYTIREGLLCCGDGKDFSAVEMRSTYYPRYSSGQAMPYWRGGMSVTGSVDFFPMITDATIILKPAAVRVSLF